jgi:lipocalin
LATKREFKMKFRCAALSPLFLALTISSAQGQECKTVNTVDEFDIETYASAPWYVHQQAVTRYSPLDQNYCTRAEYEVRESSSFWGYSVNVNNYAQDADGNEYGGTLCAYQTQLSDSKLAVAPCFLPKFAAGPYWVVAYNEDEGYALVSGGQPTIPADPDGATAGCRTGEGINNSGLWIFSRKPERDDTLIETVRGIAKDAGFDLTVLNDVSQEGCDYGEEEGPTSEDVCVDDEGTFYVFPFGQRDCEWVGDFPSLRCLFFSSRCLNTCNKC